MCQMQKRSSVMKDVNTRIKRFKKSNRLKNAECGYIEDYDHDQSPHKKNPIFKYCDHDRSPQKNTLFLRTVTMIIVPTKMPYI